MSRKNFKFLIFLSLILLLFSFSLVLAQGTTCDPPCPNGQRCVDGKCVRLLEVKYPEIGGIKPETVAVGLPNYVKYIFNFSIIGFGLVVLAVLIWGGIRYLTSAGEPAKLKDAREQILAAFLGIVILLSSYIILTTINPQLVIFHVPLLTRPATCKGLPGDCPPDYECIGGDCVRFTCATDNDCKQKLGKDYVCDPEQKICVLEMEELTLISLEIPLAQMIDKGVWGKDRISMATSTLERFETFLKEEISVNPSFNKISDLNKYLKTLTDDCRCDALTSLCDKPENWASKVGCAGDPCKDSREKITKILKINEEKIKKLNEYREQIAQQLEFFNSEGEKYGQALEEIGKCSDRGVILTRNEYLSLVEFYEEQGWKTKTITSPGYQPLSPVSPAGGLSVELTSYYPGAPIGKKKIEGGLYDMRGNRLYTLRGYKDGTTSYVSIAVAMQLYKNGTFHYGDIVRIPELEQDYGNKIRFVVVDTGPALTNAYPNTIKIDIATYATGENPIGEVNRSATITKESGGSAGDPLTFYCSYGGTMFDMPKRPLPGASEEFPTEAPPEIVEFEPLSCPAYIPIGEMLDGVEIAATDNNDMLAQLDYLIDETVKEIRNMANLISECNEKNCEADCGCVPNPCHTPVPLCDPPPLGCGPIACQSPCLQSVGVCKGNKPNPPYHGSPCPRDDIEKTLAKIKEHEDYLFSTINDLKSNLSSKPYVLEVPEGSANLFGAVKAAANICYNENLEKPTWAVLNCGLSLGNLGPDNKTIGDCHPQSFFCCTDDKAAAARARSVLPGEAREVTYYTGPFPVGGVGYNNVPYFAQGGQCWSSDKLGHGGCKHPTIGGAGCLVSSIAMVASFHGIRIPQTTQRPRCELTITTPRAVNDFGRRMTGGFSGCYVTGLPKQLAGLASGLKANRINSKTRVLNLVREGFPVVIGSTGGGNRPYFSGGQHWVVLTGVDDKFVYTNDPNRSQSGTRKWKKAWNGEMVGCHEPGRCRSLRSDFDTNPMYGAYIFYR